MNEIALACFIQRYKLPDRTRALKVLTAGFGGRDAMGLVYEWTKTNVIGLKEFKGLMNMILMEEIDAEQCREVDTRKNTECWIDEGD